VVRLRPATATDVWAWSRGRSDFDPRSRTVFLVYPTVYAQQRSMYKMSHKPTSPITAINSYKTRQIKRLPIYVSLYNYSCAAVGKISTESTRRAVPLRQSNYLYSVHAHFLRLCMTEYRPCTFIIYGPLYTAVCSNAGKAVSMCSLCRGVYPP